MKTGWNVFFGFIIFCHLLAYNLFTQPVTFEELQPDHNLRVYYQQEQALKITTIYILFPGGQRIEPQNKAGLSYLTTRLMAEVPDEDKLAELVSKGINLSAGSRADFSFIQIDTLSEHLEKALKIITSLIKNPLFSGPRIDSIKRSLLSEARKENCRLVDSAKICLHRRLFPGLSYSQSLFGNEQSLKAISKKDVTEFYEKIFNPVNLSLLIVSDLEIETINQLTLKYFSALKMSAKKFELPVFSENILNISMAAPANCGNYQGPSGTAVLLAYVFPGTVSEIFPQAYLLEKIIGEGPGSLLWQLRQENALAYNLNSWLEVIDNKVVLQAYLENENQTATSALESLKKIFNNLAESGLKQKEIETGKLLARSNYLLEAFSRDARINRLALFLANNLPLAFYNQFLTALDELQPSTLNDLIRSTFKPENAMEIIISKN